LGFVPIQHFQEDCVVPFQVTVDLEGGLFCGVAQLLVIFVFAAYGTEGFIGSSVQGFSAYFALPFQGFPFVTTNIRYSFLTDIFIYNRLLTGRWEDYLYVWMVSGQ